MTEVHAHQNDLEYCRLAIARSFNFRKKEYNLLQMPPTCGRVEFQFQPIPVEAEFHIGQS